ncbi:MAG: 7-cyano-7-deazaguanine synthase QueC [Candidatus Omnitrophota bacterium]
MKDEKSLPAGRQAVVLLSGGLDSATALYLAKNSGFKCFCLIFDYGQRHRKEISSAKEIAKAAGSSYKILKINLPWKGSALLDKKVKVPKPVNSSTRKPANLIPVTYVPGRNIIFLSFALSYAEAIKAKAIFIGAHCQDYSGYPDCRPQFYRAFYRVSQTGTRAGSENHPVKIISPLINKTKAQIIKLGQRLKVPFKLTWSCYRGLRHPCGKCDSCKFRIKGFKEAGIKDPAIYES